MKVQQEKLQKAAQKAEAAEMKKVQKEKQKWEKGKFALKSIVAEIDTKVVEVGSIGGTDFLRLYSLSFIGFLSYASIYRSSQVLNKGLTFLVQDTCLQDSQKKAFHFV